MGKRGVVGGKFRWICYATLSDDTTKFISTGLRYLPPPEKHTVNNKVIKERRTQCNIELHGTAENLTFIVCSKVRIVKSTAASIDTVYGVKILFDFS